MRIGGVNKWAVLAAALLFIFLWQTFGPVSEPSSKLEASVRSPAISPSGKYRMVVVEGFDGHTWFRQFQVETTDVLQPGVLCYSKHRIRCSDSSNYVWDNSDWIWIHSGDIGTYRWVRAKNDQWIEVPGNIDEAPAPL